MACLAAAVTVVRDCRTDGGSTEEPSTNFSCTSTKKRSPGRKTILAGRLPRSYKLNSYAMTAIDAAGVETGSYTDLT
jgi:hypothetical protein